jgi:hypothetical protein
MQTIQPLSKPEDHMSSVPEQAVQSLPVIQVNREQVHQHLVSVL